MASGDNHIEGVNLNNLGSSSSSNVSSNDQLDWESDEEDDSLTPELKNKVFKNELIRDQIFDYVFSSNLSDKTLVNKDVLTCRLVDHAWLDYITSRLQKSGSPEYTLDFRYSYKSKEGQNRREKKYQVNKFFDTWLAFPGAGRRIPLFKMEINAFGSSKEFHVQSLVNCLTLCGNGLHHLTLDLQFSLPDDNDDDAKDSAYCMNYVATAGEINLPNLKELRVVLTKFKNNKPLVSLLLSRILFGCQRLTFFSLADQRADPSGWSRLFLEEEVLSGISKQLPKTLVKLEFNMKITTELFEKLLLENWLPKLSWLKLGYMTEIDNEVLSRIIHRYSRQLNYFFLDGDHARIGTSSSANRLSRLFLEEEVLSGISEPLPNTLVKLQITMNITTELLEKLLLESSLPYLSWLWLGYKIDADTDVLARIIHRYSRQLNYFFLDGDYTRMGASSSANRVVFPVMTKLKDMFISYLHPEPEPEINHSFPTLQTLTLESQTPAMLQNWIRNSPFSCVEEFAVDLCANTINAEYTFTLELSRQLHVAFPHIQKLEINFGQMCRSEDESIQNIFEYMPQLRDLTLRLHLSDHPRGAYSWDAILLGVTPEYAKTLAESPREEWGTINLNHQRTPLRSIVNLSRLTRFQLVDTDGFLAWESIRRTLLISDISFRFAFLRMSNLETLTLDGAFGATKEMVTRWEQRGCKFLGRVKLMLPWG